MNKILVINIMSRYINYVSLNVKSELEQAGAFLIATHELAAN